MNKQPLKPTAATVLQVTQHVDQLNNPNAQFWMLPNDHTPPYHKQHRTSGVGVLGYDWESSF